MRYCDYCHPDDPHSKSVRYPVKSYVFKVTIEPDKFQDGREAWQAHCPALKGCATWGHTREEALANILEAIDLYVQDLVQAGERATAF